MSGAMRTLALLFLVAGCTDASGPAAPDPGGGGKADGDGAEAAATLTFAGDFSTSASGPITQVSTVRIDYDPTRLAQCEKGEYGPRSGPRWQITAYWRFGDTGTIESAGVATASFTSHPTIDVPFASELQVWFFIDNGLGCTAYDSNNGSNYRFSVEPPTHGTIHFTKDFATTSEGDLSDRTLFVDYDLSRLPDCRYYPGGVAGWDIQASWRFDGGETHTGSVTRKLPDGDRVAAPLVIAAPDGAHDLEMWFENFDEHACAKWDSNNGANYHIAL